MSISEVTSRCFHNGIDAPKWLSMCRIIRDKNSIETSAFEQELCSFILSTFYQYPLDPLLYSYLKHAISTEELSLSTPTTMFLELSSTPTALEPSTSNAICDLILLLLNNHLSSGLSRGAILLGPDYATDQKTVNSLRGVLDLLRMAYKVSTFPFHPLVHSASRLAIHIAPCITELLPVATTDAINIIGMINELFHSYQLDPELQPWLENITMSLSVIYGDDFRLTQETQLMRSKQSTLGKGDVLGPNSDSDLISCSLLLRQLVNARASPLGHGYSLAVSALLATYRWSNWSPRVFYTQLLLSAISILAQFRTHRNLSLLWRSFIITRLTAILSDFERVLVSEGTTNAEWRVAMQTAILTVQNRTDLLSLCDEVPISIPNKESEDSGNNMDVDTPDNAVNPPFFRTFVQYCARRTKLFDKSTLIKLKSLLEPPLTTILGKDSQDSGLSLENYVESKLINEWNNDESLGTFFSRAFDDIPNHPLVVKEIEKRVKNLCSQQDVESLGTLCKVLNANDLAIEVIPLHIDFIEFVSYLLAFVEDFDCDSVGDPQTAVGQFGNIILFLQAVFQKYKLSSYTFTLGDRKLPTDYLLSTSAVYRASQFDNYEVAIVKKWASTLFQEENGIGDNILVGTKPKILLKLTASIIMQACSICNSGRMKQEQFKNGMSYFDSDLLRWTLVGGIKALLYYIFEKDCSAPLQMGALQTLVQSKKCPQTVLRLTGHGILALASDPKAKAFEKSLEESTKKSQATADKNTDGKSNEEAEKAEEKKRNAQFDLSVLRDIASKALGIDRNDPIEADLGTLSINTQSHWLDQPRNIMRNAFQMARLGKAPSFDVIRCVTILGPTRFLFTFWEELDSSAQIGDLELSRRFATHVLLCFPGVSVECSPALLHIFLGSVLRKLLAQLDGYVPAKQTFGIELLVAVIASSLTYLFQIEGALRAVAADINTERVIWQSSVSVARRLASDLKRSQSPSAAAVLQRLSASPSFVANFPMMAA